MKTTKLSCAVMMLAVSRAASGGSSITYDFTVEATSGTLSGDKASGSFTFDHRRIPIGGGTVYETGLLSALNFTWGGISYNASAANTGWLTFNSEGDLTFFIFGTDCTAIACAVNPPATDWFAASAPSADGFAYSDGDSSGSGDVSYSLVTSAQEPATLGLLGLGLASLGFGRRMRKRRLIVPEEHGEGSGVARDCQARARPGPAVR